MRTFLKNFSAMLLVGSALLTCGPHRRKIDTLKALPLLSKGMTYTQVVEKLGPPSMESPGPKPGQNELQYHDLDGRSLLIIDIEDDKVDDFYPSKASSSRPPVENELGPKK